MRLEVRATGGCTGSAEAAVATALPPWTAGPERAGCLSASRGLCTRPCTVGGWALAGRRRSMGLASTWRRPRSSEARVSLPSSSNQPPYWSRAVDRVACGLMADMSKEEMTVIDQRVRGQMDPCATCRARRAQGGRKGRTVDLDPTSPCRFMAPRRTLPVLSIEGTINQGQTSLRKCLRSCWRVHSREDRRWKLGCELTPHFSRELAPVPNCSSPASAASLLCHQTELAIRRETPSGCALSYCPEVGVKKMNA